MMSPAVLGTLPEMRLTLPRPNFMDRLVAAVAPGYAMQRMRARAALSWLGGIGGYTGARSDRRETKDWGTRAASADADQIPDLATLRSRSRDLVRNAPLTTGCANTIERNTVGSGLWPTPQVDRDFLGISEEEADRFERQAARLFALWADSVACDAEGKQSFPALQSIVCRSELESGDILAIRRYIERPGDLFGFKIQLVEADRVCNPNFLPDTDRMRAGVELDANGAPVQFQIANRHPDDLFSTGPLIWSPVRARGAATGERQVLHIYRALRVSQTRGVPAFAAVIELLKQIDRFMGAELMATVVGALFTVFVKQEESLEGEGQGLAGLETSVATLANELKLGHGAVVDLGKGESIELAESKRPNDRLDPFFIACCRQLGAAIELPYEMVVLHFTSSYSASRAAFQEAWRAFLTRRSRLASQFCQPCYEWVLTEAVARGFLQAPGFFENPLLRAAWCGARWTGPVQSSLSPVDDATAAEKWLAMGVKTLDETTAEITGGDWERNHRQRVKEVTMRRRDGLDVEPVAERIVTEPRTPIPNPDQQEAQRTDPNAPPPAEVANAA